MTTAQAETNRLTQFNWTTQPEAETVVRELVEDFLEESSWGRHLASQMQKVSGTRFTDWIDHIRLSASPELRERFLQAGYRATLDAHDEVLTHPGGVFPAIVLGEKNRFEVALKVDSVADFLACYARETEVEGQPLSQYRRAIVGSRANLSVVERHGWRGFTQPAFDPARAIAALKHLEIFRSRQRVFNVESDGFDHVMGYVDAAANDIGIDYTCDLFFAAEREFWMRRNRAARVQYARQQRLGLGWANHDHHTYRSSREHFTRLVAVWEKLGFVCRERFYAGAEAGWGAQVMEHPVTGIVTFNDVDLSPDELLTDFAHEPLEPRKELGTVGLWCALHSESFLEAGMHHLECMFDFDALKRQLESDYAIKVMKPFTDFPHLRQAFTEGERWAVRPERIERLLNDGRITAEQAEKFRTEGAIGSHLENLERNAGFKGFNQKGVSEIISATDPRKQI